MLGAMHGRAPDGEQMFDEGPVALGQSFLRTGTSGAERENALTLDRKVWVVADARIDGRRELLQELRSRGLSLEEDVPHGELLLHAYAAFGEDLVHHLIGDFAFALWDAPKRKLLCVRDHFGVRPFYYAMTGGRLYFASDIAGLLAVDEIPQSLDEQAMGEFLLLGMSLEPERTIFKAIHCLAPACMMVISGANMTTKVFWRLERGAEQRYRRREEYVKRFREIFDQAVIDRLPGGPVALQLSGGMDSTSIAAVAAKAAVSTRLVRGYHLTSERFVPDDHERGYAQQAADHLGIELVWQDLGDTPLFAHALEPRLRTAQPMPAPHLAMHAETLERIRQGGARVWLSGYMGDAVLSSQAHYYTDLLRRYRLAKFVREAAHHWRLSHSVRGLGLRTVVRRRAESPAWKPPMPDWIDPEFARKNDLPAVWQRFWEAHENSVDGFEQLRLAWIGHQFRASEVLPSAVVVRYPFLDLRLVEFLGGVPNCLLTQKQILREAMRMDLPPAILARPKTGLAGDFVRTMVTNGIIDPCVWSTALPSVMLPERFYQALVKYREGEGAGSTWSSWLFVQSFALGLWLANNAIARKDVSDV